jgi:hypothetical protein
MEISRRFRHGSTIISMLALSLLFYDFFMSRKFYIETSFMLVLGAVLTANIVRQSFFSGGKSALIPCLVNLAIIGIACFDLWVLVIFLFGSGFSGKPIQQIWYNLTGMNLLLFITAVIEVVIIAMALLKKPVETAADPEVSDI